MYSYPIYLPEFSNREDLLLTVAVFDDDSGEPLDFSGRTLASPGDYTSNLWLVQDGAIVTSSADVLTIPDYPIGNELSAVTLTVDPNLPIAPGDPVTISNLPINTPPPTPLVSEDGSALLVSDSGAFLVNEGYAPPTISSLVPGPNTMTGYVTSYTAGNGVLVAQIGSTFQFEIRALMPPNYARDGYGIWPDFGLYPDYGPLIVAALGTGVTMVDIGLLQIRIPELTFRRLNNRTYSAALTMTDTIDTRQVFIARLPMQWGAVTQ